MSATFVIQIKTETSGVTSATRQVGTELDKVKQKALDVNSALRSIFGIYALKEVFTGLMSLTNGYQAVENKIRTVTDSQANLNGVMAATFKVAQDTRTSWDSTTIMYQRLALNSKTLGASQKELIDFTKHLNEEVIVSGATSKEASSGIIQLAQGMAAGRLHGQDLRAVMEDLPGVVDVIAKHFHTTRGALYQMGSQGKITSQEILKAFQEAGPGIEKAFGNTLPTISQGIEKIRNAAEKFFGEAGEGSGVLGFLGRMLSFVSDHFDSIGKVIIAVTQALLGLYVLNEIIKLFTYLNAVIRANPFVALVTILVTTVLLLRQFSDQISIGSDAGAHLSDVFAVLWMYIKEIAAAIWDFIKGAWHALTDAFSSGVDSTGIELSLRNATLFVGSFVATSIGLFNFLKDSVYTVFGGIPVVIGEQLVGVAQDIAKVFQKLINDIIDGINKINAFFLDTFNSANMQQALLEGRQKGLSGDDLTKFVAGRSVDKGVQLEHVDFSFSNPLEGATTAFVDKFKEDFKKDVTDFVPEALKLITGFFDKVDEHAKQKVAEKPSVVHTTAGVAAVPPPTSAEIAARNKLIAELDGLIKRGTPYEAAVQKIADANKILANPQARDILKNLFGTDPETVLAGIQQRLKPVLDMAGEFITKTIERTSAMRGSREEEELALALEQEREKIEQNGGPITEAKIAEIKHVIALSQDRNRVWREEQKILDEISGPEKQYVLALRAINLALEEQAINQHQANMAREQAARQLLSAGGAAAGERGDLYKLTKASVDPDALTHGFDDGINHVMQSMLNLSATVSDAMNNTFQSLEKNILSAVETGKFAWDDLANTAVQELNKIALKILETWLLTMILNAALGGGGGAVGAVVSAVNGNSAGPQGANPGISGPITSPVQLDGGSHASGGSYVVPGSGGPDSRSVMFHLTPGERVDFTPPGQMARGGTTLGPRGRNQVVAEESGRKGGSTAGSAGRGQGTTNIVMIDGRSIIPALMTPEGQRAILQVIANNPDIIKGIR